MVLGVYGASGLGTEFMGLAKAIARERGKWSTWTERVFIDDDPSKSGTTLSECPVMTFKEAIEKYGKDGIEFVIGIGEPEVKDIIFKKLMDEGCKMTHLISFRHKRFGPGSKVGKGIVVHAASAMPPLATYGNNILIQQSAMMGHSVVIGDNVVVSSQAYIGPGATIGRNTYVGPHACIRDRVRIGENCIIGMGAVVTKDIPDNAVAFGCPARVVRQNTSGRVFKK